MSRAIIRGPVLEVRTPTELHGLRRQGRPIALVGWPADLRASHDAQLTRWATACGCDTGAALMLIATATTLVLVGVDLATRGLASFSLLHIGALVAALVGGAVVGKAIGLAWAELRWREALRAAADAYSARASFEARPEPTAR